MLLGGGVEKGVGRGGKEGEHEDDGGEEGLDKSPCRGGERRGGGREEEGDGEEADDGRAHDW
jgi:hypothetical protein